MHTYERVKSGPHLGRVDYLPELVVSLFSAIRFVFGAIFRHARRLVCLLRSSIQHKHVAVVLRKFFFEW